jgi:predicted pyridoxine 5'-phosphate oxidase superfamily flavin-nucleotide-binding protein
LLTALNKELAMPHRYAEIAFTPIVQAEQERHGSRRQYAQLQASARTSDRLGDAEAQFLRQADSFYLASVSETGWPYVQHRGGPHGFLKVLGPTQLAFADFRGNRQYVSAGNAAGDDRVALIVMDHVHQSRLKLFGHLRFVDIAAADPAVARAVLDPGYPARVERVGLIQVAAFDWNCPQHITQRFTLEQVEDAVAPWRARIAELERELAAARAQRADTL